ncbi:MAG: sodium:solute symporter family protein, partial [Ignavibacteriaceae bacterium]|nr:sodium:solute symporter family protein [Ignavibacteriaceae bacterium]
GLIWVTAVVVGIFITFGGQTAVIFTDLVQGVMLIFAGLLVFILGIYFLGGWDSFWHLLPTSWKLPFAGFNSPAEFNSVGIFWEDAIAGSVGFLFMNMGLIMRFMATKNVHEGRKAATANILFMLPVSAIVVGGGGWVAKAISVARPDLISPDSAPDSVFVLVSHILTGPGVFGFVIAAIVAALMSTVSTLLNATAAIWVNDVDKPIRIWLKKIKKEDETDEKRAMIIARVSTVAFTIIGVLAVYAFKSYPTIYQAHAFFHATITPPLMVAIFFGAFWKKFTPAGLITTVLGGVTLMLLGFKFPQQLIQPLAHGTPYDPVHPFTYMAALYNLIVCLSVAVVVTLFHDKLKKLAKKIRKNSKDKGIMYVIIALSVIIIIIDMTAVFLNINFGGLAVLLPLTLLMCAFVAVTTTVYVKYNEETQVLGLTIGSIRHAKEWFKGGKLNEREGEKVKAHWKIIEGKKDEINFSSKEMHKMQAEVGDLVYIADNRKWLGGLKSCHSVIGEPHDEHGVIMIRQLHLEKAQFVEGKIIEAEKEM